MRLRGVLMIVSFYWWTKDARSRQGQIFSYSQSPFWSLHLKFVCFDGVIFLLFAKPVRYILGARTWTLGHKRFLFTPLIETRCDSRDPKTTQTCTLYALPMIWSETKSSPSIARSIKMTKRQDQTRLWHDKTCHQLVRKVKTRRLNRLWLYMRR